MPEKILSLLSIAGSDPMGGAGIQADILAGNKQGLHVLTAITAITAQNSMGISAILPTEPNFLESQLKSISEDVFPDAIKIGMIGSKENFRVVSHFLESLSPNIPVVVDPVLSASANNISMAKDCNPFQLAKLYKEYIFPFATVITPNIPEFQIFTNNTIEKEWNSISPYFENKAVIIKGGHNKKTEATDTLVSGYGVFKITHQRVDCRNLHGTGCVFSSILAALLARGLSLEKAFFETSDSMSRIILRSGSYSLGNSNYGPLNICDTYI